METDFTGVSSAFLISSTPLSQVIRTTARIGFQPTRSFTVLLLPNNSMASLDPLLHINGSVTINILDDPNRKGESCICFSRQFKVGLFFFFVVVFFVVIFVVFLRRIIY